MSVSTIHLVIVNPFLIGVDFIPVVRDFVDKVTADIAGVFLVRVVEPLKPCSCNDLNLCKCNFKQLSIYKIIYIIAIVNHNTVR